MDPNGLDHRSGDAIGVSDELVEPESEYRPMGSGERRIPAAVSTPCCGIGVKRIAVGLDHDRILENQVYPPDAGEKHLGSNPQAGISSDESRHRLEA